jgi:hypothetical protein
MDGGEGLAPIIGGDAVSEAGGEAPETFLKLAPELDSLVDGDRFEQGDGSEPGDVLASDLAV